MGQVQGKVAIVTGGASGIGAACVATLAREGAKVIVSDLDDPRGQALVDRIASDGGEAIYLHQDVSLEEGWPGVIEATERRFGHLDVMVANAGIGIMCEAVEMSLVDWRRQTAVNLDGVFLSVKYAVPAMRRFGGSLCLAYGNPHGSPDEWEDGTRHRSERRYRQGDRPCLGSRGCRCRNLRASPGAAGNSGVPNRARDKPQNRRTCVFFVTCPIGNQRLKPRENGGQGGWRAPERLSGR
jgi:NAD(P)-dependent dehydrogenase (short-subunit alcohol dehydrogenase family)